MAIEIENKTSEIKIEEVQKKVNIENKNNIVEIKNNNSGIEIKQNKIEIEIRTGGAKGDKGDKGEPGGSYQFEQVIPATNWIIVHNLGRAVNSTVFDSSGNKFMTDEKYIDDNTTEIIVNRPLTGSGICS